MFSVRLHRPPTTGDLLIFLLLIALAIARLIYLRKQRRAKWAEVLDGAHRWIAAIGGQLLRISEREPLYSGVRGPLVARRYRVTYIDHAGTQCIAMLRYEMLGSAWRLDDVVQSEPPEPFAPPDVFNQAKLSAESHARRHRGKIADVPVIFKDENGDLNLQPRRRTS